MLALRAAAAILLCAAAAGPALAQDEDAQLWTSSTAEIGLDDRTTLAAQFVARFSSDAGGVSELQYQADLERDLDGGLSLGAGYSYVPRYDRGDLVTREHRIRQQIGAELGRLLGGKVETRLRLEQRWRDDGDDVALRLRGRIMWTRPVGPDDLAVRVWHESFLHLNDTDWAGTARYARSRSQVSLRRKFGDAITGELGYLNQYSIADSGSDQLVHAMTLAVTFDF